MTHSAIPDLPTSVHTREEFVDIVERLFEFYQGFEAPIRLSGFGFWGKEDEKDRSLMRGGVMFSVFEEPRKEPLGTVRTTFPLPDVFDVMDDLRGRLRRSGCIVSHLDGDGSTHVLSIRRPGIPDQIWDYGIEADDDHAILLFLQHDCTNIRRGV